MDTTAVLWIVVGIVALLVVLGLVFFIARKRRQEHERAQRAEDQKRAADLRKKAEEAELDARESEVQAARAQAEADQALLDAERLHKEAEQRQEDAGDLHRDSADKAEHADAMDPDVDTDAAAVENSEEYRQAADPGRAGDGSVDGRPSGGGNSLQDPSRRTDP
ncbi:hypothetical protein [Arthrobacter sp. R-11]|uniref:hypothetical protein n=1 Tax=Arthrobacter sp. R-11 TaxID=3404053 RepID=UPI003CF36495